MDELDADIELILRSVLEARVETGTRLDPKCAYRCTAGAVIVLGILAIGLSDSHLDSSNKLISRHENKTIPMAPTSDVYLNELRDRTFDLNQDYGPSSRRIDASSDATHSYEAILSHSAGLKVDTRRRQRSNVKPCRRRRSLIGQPRWNRSIATVVQSERPDPVLSAGPRSSKPSQLSELSPEGPAAAQNQLLNQPANQAYNGESQNVASSDKKRSAMRQARLEAVDAIRTLRLR